MADTEGDSRMADRERDWNGSGERWKVALTLRLWHFGNGIQQEATSERQRLAGLVWQRTPGGDREKGIRELAGRDRDLHAHTLTHTQKKYSGNSNEVQLTGTDFSIYAHQRHHVLASEKAAEVFDRRYLWDDESGTWVNIKRWEAWLLLCKDK